MQKKRKFAIIVRKVNNMALINIKNSRIENSREVVVPCLSWEMKSGEAWLVIGPNGGGKADFLNALSAQNSLKICQNNAESVYENVFSDSVEIVSLERAAHLIQEERENDESDYVEGGVDIGRTGRVFIAESLYGPVKKNMPLPQEIKRLEALPEIKLCGIEKILDRGLKYMSTGEIRRTLLARALVSKKKLLILSDPFAGLDIQSRTILLDFFNTIVNRQLKENSSAECPHIILGMERWHEIPDAITHVLEFSDKKITFCGPRSEYEKIVAEREEKSKLSQNDLKNELKEQIAGAAAGSEFVNHGGAVSLQNAPQTATNSVSSANSEPSSEEKPEVLIKMTNVNVGWGDNHVLQNLSWQLNKGEHWLIQGPNGSGKTTFLELITGDNMQVFANDVWLFGAKRGSGESIWDIKKQLGIVSYRLHVEYRMLGGTSLLNVIISGFRDSIGLYGGATDLEISAAKKWLALGGFAGRENENFGSLSYGEQRAILIIRATVKSPKVLILDEPCHGLDQQFRSKVLNLLEIIGEQNTTTMLHVTHDPSEVLSCEHHVLELHPGETPMYKILDR
jgi:molybdate transport system ATP-binding protein